MNWRDIMGPDVLRTLRIEEDLRRMTRITEFDTIAEDLRRMRELNEADRIVRELRQADEVARANDVATEIRRATESVQVPSVVEDVRRAMKMVDVDSVAKQFREMRELITVPGVAELAQHLSEVCVLDRDLGARIGRFSSPAYRDFLDSYIELERNLKQSTELAATLPWDQITSLAPTTLSLLSELERDRALGVLTSLTDPNVDGLFTWKYRPTEVDEWSLASACWMQPGSSPEKGDSMRVEVRSQLFCGLCGGRMVVLERTFEHRSEREVDEVTLVFPLCPRCARAADGSPEYWIGKLEEIAEGDGPRFRLIHGGGKGDGKPDEHPHLQLVEDDEDEESKQ